MTDVAEVLRKARAKITPEGAWTQEYLARDAANCPVSEVDPSAVCWCAFGVIGAVSSMDTWMAAIGIFGRAIGERAIGYWNDAPERTHAEVLAAFDKAIAASEGAQP